MLPIEGISKKLKRFSRNVYARKSKAELRALYFKIAHRVCWHIYASFLQSSSGEATLTVSAWTEGFLHHKFSILPKRLYLKWSTTSFNTYFLHCKGACISMCLDRCSATASRWNSVGPNSLNRANDQSTLWWLWKSNFLFGTSSSLASDLFSGPMNYLIHIQGRSTRFFSQNTLNTAIKEPAYKWPFMMGYLRISLGISSHQQIWIWSS